jgi:hypothetical protein
MEREEKMEDEPIPMEGSLKDGIEEPYNTRNNWSVPESAELAILAVLAVLAVFAALVRVGGGVRGCVRSYSASSSSYGLRRATVITYVNTS